MGKLLKFLRGSLESNLPQALQDGHIYHCENTGNTYVGGTNNTKKIFSSSVGRAILTSGKLGEIFNDYTNNTASGEYSHAEGMGTIANAQAQHVQGKYNVADTTQAFIIGGGTSSARSNIFTLDWNGNAWVKNTVYSPNGIYTTDSTNTKILSLDRNGNAITASKLKTARTITFDGGIEGSFSFDGSSNITCTVGVLSDKHEHDDRYYTETEMNTKLSGKAKGSEISGTTPATAGWYRIAISPLNISNCNGIFEITAAVSGKHTVTTIAAGTSYGIVGSSQVVVLNCGHYSSSAITKARIVYHTTYSNNYAYLEIYNPSNSALSITVRLLGGNSWSLVSPSTVGSIPSGYTNKEVTLANGSMVSEKFVGALTGNADTATKATQDGSGNIITSTYLPLKGGKLTGQLSIDRTAANKTSPTAQDLVINYSLPSGTSLTEKNAPGIGFHIGNNSWGSLIFDGTFKFVNNNFTGYMPVKASKFIGDLEGKADALKLTSDIGSVTQPVYFKADGKPYACTYTLGKSVPSNADFTNSISRIYAGASGTAANSVLTNPYIKITDDNTYRNQIRLVGGGSTTITSDANGNITISSTDNDTKYSHPTHTARTSGLYKITVDGLGHVTDAVAVTKSDITALGIPAQDTTYTLSSFGLTATAEELNYCDGVTSGIQSQLNTLNNRLNIKYKKLTYDGSSGSTGSTLTLSAGERKEIEISSKMPSATQIVAVIPYISQWSGWITTTTCVYATGKYKIGFYNAYSTALTFGWYVDILYY